MPLDVPNLDDRNYADLVEEALGMLSRYAPTWTNHNPTDPGITVVELLAYFTEMHLFRLNNVTRASKLQFLRLLEGPDEDVTKNAVQPSEEEVDTRIKLAVLKLRQRQRAVTCEDFEFLTREAAAASSESEAREIQSRCIARRALDLPDAGLREIDRPGHVSVVVVPAVELDPPSFDTLLQHIREYLEPKRLLATQLHVVKPCYLQLAVGAVVRQKAGVSFADLQDSVTQALEHYFSPYRGGGPEGNGWSLGRHVYLSEVQALLQQTVDVERVGTVQILGMSASDTPLDDDQTAVGVQLGMRSTLGVDSRLGAETVRDARRLIISGSGRLVGVALRPYEVVGIEKVVVREEPARWSESQNGGSVSGSQEVH